MPTPKRTAKEAWKSLEEARDAAEIDDALALTDDEVAARLRARGEDPEALRAEGLDFVKQLQANRDRLAWQVEAAEGLARERARVATYRGRFDHMDRPALLEKLAAMREDPRLTQPVTVMFRNRKPEEATEAELRALLEEIEALADRKK